MGRTLPSTIHGDEAKAALPPAGHEQREELLRRLDDLQQQIDSLSSSMGVEAIDRAVLEPDTEIISILDNARVTDERSGFTYRWVQFKRPLDSPGLIVEMHINEGWKVVQGGDPECAASKNVEGTRVKGDLLLMRIPTELKQKLDSYRNRTSEARHNSAMGRVQDAVKQVRRKAGNDRAVKVVEINEMTAKERQRLDQTNKQQFAKKAAGQQFEEQIRDGTVAGMELRT